MATTIKESKASRDNDISNQLTSEGLIERKKPRKKLSDHVMTRVYRAPEVITLMDYNKKVDTWSVGCILAELIRYTEEYRDQYPEEKYLFSGDSCFPLSPNPGEDGLAVIDKDDQIAQISTILGPLPYNINEENPEFE